MGVVFLEVFGASEIVPLQFIIGMKRGKVLRYAGEITAILRNNMDFNSLVPRLSLHSFPFSSELRPGSRAIFAPPAACVEFAWILRVAIVTLGSPRNVRHFELLLILTIPAN